MKIYGTEHATYKPTWRDDAGATGQRFSSRHIRAAARRYNKRLARAAAKREIKDGYAGMDD